MIQSGFVLESASRLLASSRQLLAAYDPRRRLAQGWSIATTGEGTIVRSIGDVQPGDLVRVRVSDGSFESTVTGKNGESS